MNEHPSFEQFETQLKQLAQAFTYPATPNLATAVTQRIAAKSVRPRLHSQRLAWSVALGLIIIFGLVMTTPPVRIKLLDIIGLGSGQTQLAEPTPTLITPTMTITGLPSPTSRLLTATPQAAATPFSSSTNTNINTNITRPTAELIVYAPALPPQTTRTYP
jgi:hypothetical protein